MCYCWLLDNFALVLRRRSVADRGLSMVNCGASHIRCNRVFYVGVVSAPQATVPKPPRKALRLSLGSQVVPRANHMSCRTCIPCILRLSREWIQTTRLAHQRLGACELYIAWTFKRTILYSLISQPPDAPRQSGKLFESDNCRHRWPRVGRVGAKSDSSRFLFIGQNGWQQPRSAVERSVWGFLSHFMSQSPLCLSKAKYQHDGCSGYTAVHVVPTCTGGAISAHGITKRQCVKLVMIMHGRLCPAPCASQPSMNGRGGPGLLMSMQALSSSPKIKQSFPEQTAICRLGCKRVNGPQFISISNRDTQVW